jgi:hypothetical protein
MTLALPLLPTNARSFIPSFLTLSFLPYPFISLPCQAGTTREALSGLRLVDDHCNPVPARYRGYDPRIFAGLYDTLYVMQKRHVTRPFCVTLNT